MSNAPPYLLMLTKGREDGGTAAMLTMKLAVSLQAIGRDVLIFLTLAGTRWAYEETGEGIFEENANSLETYFEQFASLGGELLVCSPCLKAYCSIPTVAPEAMAESMRDNASYAGLATIAEHLLRADAAVF